MIRLFMDLKGKVSHKLLRKSLFRERHFDEQLNFLHHEIDKVTEREKVTMVTNVIRRTDLHQLLLSKTVDHSEATRQKLVQFKDMLDKIFVFDHLKRISIKDCILHPFIQEPF